MDPEEYEQIFGYLSDKRYPNDIKESEKRRIRKMSYKFVIEGSDLFFLEKDKLSDNMVKRMVITKDKLSTDLKMCHNSSGHQGVNKIVNKIKFDMYLTCVFLIAIKLKKNKLIISICFSFSRKT